MDNREGFLNSKTDSLGNQTNWLDSQTDGPYIQTDHRDYLDTNISNWNLNLYHSTLLSIHI